MDKPAQWALVGAAWFLALTVAMISFLAWRHFDATSQANRLIAAAAQGQELKLPDGASAICPVTKEKLIITKDTPHLIYKDRVYYFSTTLDPAGKEPKRLFLMDPEFYASPGTPALVDKSPDALNVGTTFTAKP